MSDTIPRPYQAPEWHHHTACAGMPEDIFFPGDAGVRTRHALFESGKEVCRGCPVREQCLNDQLDYEATTDSSARVYGLYGAHAPAERLPLLRERQTDTATCSECGTVFHRPDGSQRRVCDHCGELGKAVA